MTQITITYLDHFLILFRFSLVHWICEMLIIVAIAERTEPWEDNVHNSK